MEDGLFKYFINLGKYLKNNVGVVLFFVLLAIFRFSLINKGHRFDQDEDRYLNALYFWIEFLAGHFSHAFTYFFNALGRPGFVLVSLIPAGIQIFLTNLGLISIFNLHFYDIPSFFNALVTLVNSILFFQILLLLVSDRMIAIGGVMFYSLLVNTNLYIRHLFPYDYSILFFFIVLLLILRDSKNKQSSGHTAILCGFLSALGFLVYPGYYADVFIVAIFFVVTLRSNYFMYVVCFVGTVMFFELLSNMVGVSYLKELFQWTTRQSIINHSGASESFLFILRYLKEVEGTIGVLLFLLSLLYFIYFIFKDSTVIKWLLAVAIVMYSLNIVMGFIFSKTVFYGRTLHMYFPFLVLASARAISLIPERARRKLLLIILMMCSISSFIPFAYTYSRLSYPEDLFFKYLSRVPLNEILWVTADQKPVSNIDKNYSVVLLNFEPYDSFGYKTPSLSSNMVLTIGEPHPQDFPAYAYEHYSPQERELIKKNQYQMQIYLNSRMGRRINNEEASSRDQGSLYRAFYPRFPFVYSFHWTSEYICTKFLTWNGHPYVLVPSCQDTLSGQK